MRRPAEKLTCIGGAFVSGWNVLLSPFDDPADIPPAYRDLHTVFRFNARIVALTNNIHNRVIGNPMAPVNLHAERIRQFSENVAEPIENHPCIGGADEFDIMFLRFSPEQWAFKWR